MFSLSCVIVAGEGLECSRENFLLESHLLRAIDYLFKVDLQSEARRCWLTNKLLGFIFANGFAGKSRCGGRGDVSVGKRVCVGKELADVVLIEQCLFT